MGSSKIPASIWVVINSVLWSVTAADEFEMHEQNEILLGVVTQILESASYGYVR
jgi:hypothetical protein